MPLTKRPRKSFDCSEDEEERDCGLLESSFSSESLQSQLDPELEANMEQYRKPDASYIELIAKAILESPGQKLSLQDIYTTLEKKYPYFQVADAGWRNSVRHNLSLHECFCKTEKCGNGKGHYWTIHPIHLQDFQAGDFRRKTVKSRARQLYQQQRLHKEAGVGGVLPSPITLTSPPSTILSPIGGQTHFHFPTPPFGSPPGAQSPIPISPMLPTSPSLMYNPATGGVYYTAFPFPYMCGPAPSLSSYPLSSDLTLPSVPPPPPPSLPSNNSGTIMPQPLQTDLDVLPVTGSVPAPRSSTGGPPILPPVCCINSPPASLAALSSGGSFGTTSTLTAGIRSHIPQEKHSPFSITSILSSQHK